MLRLRAPQTIYLLSGVLALLVAQNPSFARQFPYERVTKNELGGEELGLSLLINQMALMKMLNESSRACSSNGNQQEEILELDMKIRELENELQSMKTSALDELQSMKTTTLNEIVVQSREANKELQDLMDAFLSTLQTRVTTKGKTYRMYNGPATQPQALQACQQLGGRLALIESDAESKKIRSEVGFSYTDDIWSVYYWISGTRHGNGNWIDTVTGKRMTYTNFKDQQPDNSGGHQNCLTIAPVYLGWDDRDCHNVATGYVCQFMNA